MSNLTRHVYKELCREVRCEIPRTVYDGQQMWLINYLNRLLNGGVYTYKMWCAVTQYAWTVWDERELPF